MKKVILLNTTKTAPVRLLEADATVDLRVVTEPRYAGLYEGSRVVLVDDVERLDCVRDAVLRMRAETDVDYIISATERTLQAGGYLRTLLGLPGVSFDVANALSNKYVMKQKLAHAGVPITKFRHLTSIDALPADTGGMRWPLVVKPVLGTGTMNVHAFDKPEDFAAFQASASSDALRAARVPLMVEEAVDIEWEFHCEGVVRQGELVFVAPGRYLGPLLQRFGAPNGLFLLPAGAPEGQVMDVLCRRVVAALGLTDGVVHMEGFKTPSGYVIGEITCRPGGAAIPDLVQAQYGIDLWQAFLHASLGAPHRLSPDARRGVYGHWWLPPRPGRISAMTREEELRDIPWVMRTELSARVGDRLAAASHSSEHVASVLYRAEHTEQALGRAAELARFFQLQVV